jgi:hypothetical protein
MTADLVLLLNVDNTLLNGDRIASKRADLDHSPQITRPARAAHTTLETR